MLHHSLQFGPQLLQVPRIVQLGVLGLLVQLRGPDRRTVLRQVCLVYVLLPVLSVGLFAAQVVRVEFAARTESHA